MSRSAGLADASESFADRYYRAATCGHCDFAAFADNPVASAAVAEAKLRAITTAAAELRRG